MGETEKKLVAVSKEMMEKAYAPYSHFHVGAALLCEDGTIFGGCNVENASYGAACCAERTAVFKAVSEGHTRFSAIAIAGGHEGRISGVCTPCGICRQVLSEFCDPDMPVLLADRDGYEKHTIGELLPYSFKL